MEKEKSGCKFITKFFCTLFLLIALGTSAFAIYEISLLDKIENLIRTIVIAVLALIDLLFIFRHRRICKNKVKKKNSKHVLYILLMLIFSIVCFGIGFGIHFLYGKLSNMNKSVVTYSSSLVVMATNEAEELKDIKDYKIGLFNNEESPDGYIIPKEIIKTKKLEDDNEIVNYEDYSSMLVDLYTDEIDASSKDRIIKIINDDMFDSEEDYDA